MPAEVPAHQAAAVVRLLDAPSLSPRTTSAGRLFDAAASLILGVCRIDYEGQAAMMLESVADGSAAGTYPLRLVEAEPLELDWRPLFAEMLRDRWMGVCPAVMAARFHRALAGGIVSVGRRRPDLPVVLGGGVFQNRLLTEMVVELWPTANRLGLPGVIPPGDGGLAAGQLATALTT
jgi:hydrogenase maturation protein HypF